MTRQARVVSLAEALTEQFVAFPVVFDAGEAWLAESLPRRVGQLELPSSLSPEWCATHGLAGEAGNAVVLRSLQGPNVILVSLGASYNHVESYRLAGAALTRSAGDADVAFLLPTEAIEDAAEAAGALAEGAILASYGFKKEKGEAHIDVVAVGAPLPSVALHDDIVDAVRTGSLVAEGVNWAKRLIDTPAGELTPKELAKRVATRLEKDPDVSVEIWTESRCEEEHLGGLLGVGSGSGQPVRLVYASYDPRVEGDVPHIVLVGKGVTFDSGGLSLKPADSMMAMKTDMTGSAVVLSALSIVSRLGLAVRVSAIAPMTENLTGDRAIKPGDVLTIRNGMTIEVLNTDAEGRLILADGLSLAVEVNPDAIVDVATLTGAQKVALGDDVGALFASTDELADYFMAASARTGEQLWRLPLVASYEKHIDSDVADMKNIGKPGVAGAISAALLLQRFTDGRPWVHLDIAGPGRSDSSRGYTTKGATAFGARTIVSFLAHVASDAAAR